MALALVLLIGAGFNCSADFRNLTSGQQRASMTKNVLTMRVHASEAQNMDSRSNARFFPARRGTARALRG